MYNPNNKTEGSGGKAMAGVYPFKVDDAVRTTFKSGNRGVKVTLLVRRWLIVMSRYSTI